MKRTIDCDRVFDVLTRGPFPSGDPDDGLVETHLRCCHECRQLAEALRPAVDLFHESISPDECRELPGYQGVLPRPSSQPAVSTAVKTLRKWHRSTAHVVRYDNTRWLMAWRFAGAIVLGVTISALIWGLGTIEPRHVRAVYPSEAGVTQLNSLHLNSRCWSPGDAIGLAVECCTSCHGQNKTMGLNDNSLATLQLACASCHPAVPADPTPAVHR